MASSLWVIAIAAFKVIGKTAFWFAIVVIDLSVVGYGGIPELKDQLRKLPEAVGKARPALRWVPKHPFGPALDLLAATALGALLLRFYQGGEPGSRALNVTSAIVASLIALVLWPTLIARKGLYAKAACGSAALSLALAVCVYYFDRSQPVKAAFWIILALTSIVIMVPLIVAMVSAASKLLVPVLLALMLGPGLLFRALLAVAGLEGIARIMEGIGLVALGLAGYYTYSGPGRFGLTNHQVDGLAYYGAACGALSVGFTGLSFLSERVRARLGDKK